VATFGTGPLVKSTLPAMVVVLSAAIALATAALSFASPLFFSASTPASNSDRLAPSCWVHCLLDDFS
jgi:hypothetical protein